MSNLEKTLSIIKPDAVERNLSDEIKNIFKKNKLSIIDSKKFILINDEASEFYKVHQSNHFTMIFALIYFRTYSSNDIRGRKCY